MQNNIENLFTMPQAAKLLGVEQHRVHYVLRSGGITPHARVANARLYTFEQVQQMAVRLRVTVPRFESPSSGKAQIVVDSLPATAKASDALPSVDASPADASPVDVSATAVLDSSDSQVNPDEDVPPVVGKTPHQTRRRRASA